MNIYNYSKNRPRGTLGQVKYKPNYVRKEIIKVGVKKSTSLSYLIGEKRIDPNKKRISPSIELLKEPIFGFNPYKQGECFRCGKKTYRVNCSEGCQYEINKIMAKCLNWSKGFTNEDTTHKDYIGLCHQLFMEQTVNEHKYLNRIIY